MASARYAVFGQPIAHSRSPAIHAAFAAQFGIALDYVRIEAAPDAFVAALDAFAGDGGRGANVTLPHKQRAFAACTQVSERARRAGAVNTLLRVEGDDGAPHWQGDNTDGIGLVRDLSDRHRIALAGARVLMIGAGGAAAGVAPALLDAGLAGLSITNRSADRLAALLSLLGDPRVHSRAWGTTSQLEPDTQPFDIVINTTSAGRGDAPVEWPLPAALRAGWAAVDLGYGEVSRGFLDAAGERGAGRCIDGLGMLVEQAAESFRLWHGVAPDTAPVYAALREELPAPPQS